MPDLPRPRDRDRLLDAINWLMGCGEDFETPDAMMGTYWWRSMFEARAACFEYDRDAGRYVWSAVPPVSGMPELEHPWCLLDKDGSRWAWSKTREEAEAQVARLTRDHPEYPPYRPVLAVVEVVDPEPETAPSGLRYRWESGRLMIDGMTMATWPDMLVETADSWPVPPIDREFVARLLEARDAR